MIKKELSFQSHQIHVCLQDLPSSVSEILGLKPSCDKSTLELSDYGILTPPLHTSGELVVSNGHGQLSETSSNGYKVDFIS